MSALTIAAQRLTLRPVAPEDCARFVALLGEYDVAKNLSRPPFPYSEEAFAEFQEKQAAGLAKGTDLAFAIHVAGQGAIGCIGLHRRDDGAFELGYWIGKPYWGQGFATEAGQALLAWFRARHPKEPIKASHFEDNPNSGRVLAKLGFTDTGELLAIPCNARGELVSSRAMTLSETRKERP